MRMPFERLMEQVTALSDGDAALPMGVLSRRWGEPVSRICDAIDALKVMNGEHTYIRMDVPGPEPEPCKGFRWIGQSWATCDGCGRPAWEHDGMSVLAEGFSPFGTSEMAWEVRPWEPGQAEAIRRNWGG